MPCWRASVSRASPRRWNGCTPGPGCARFLFYGREVSRYAFRIPGKYKIRGTQGKHILRRAAERILPAEFVQRPKGLIRITRDARLKRALGAMGDELLSPAAVRSRGAFDAEDVAQLRLRVARARCTEPDFYYLWTLILFELWCARMSTRGKRRPAATKFAVPTLAVRSLRCIICEPCVG